MLLLSEIHVYKFSIWFVLPQGLQNHLRSSTWSSFVLECSKMSSRNLSKYFLQTQFIKFIKNSRCISITSNLQCPYWVLSVGLVEIVGIMNSSQYLKTLLFLATDQINHQPFEKVVILCYDLMQFFMINK